MRLNVRRTALAAVSLAALSTAVLAAGNYSTYPVVGDGSFCAATVGSGNSQGGITGQGAGSIGGSTYCAQTVPAGPPALTGVESVPADTGLANGAPPQTVVIPTSLLGGATNRLIGGDFGTNLWQRGTTPLSGSSPTAAVMAADRWWAISANNVVTITKQTPASSAADYLGASGLYSVMRVARPSGTPSGATCVGQTLDKQAAAPLIGNNAIFSFYGYAPATFSASNQQVVVTVAYFTATDAAATQATIGYAGGNSSTFALSSEGAGGGVTGYTAAVGGVSAGTPGTVASGSATIPLSTTPTRYAVWAAIPAATAAGTAITGVGVSICATPTATATVSTDYFEFTGAQLEAKPATATVAWPNGVTSPVAFERRPAAAEQMFQLYYSYVANESATVVNFRGICAMSTTSIANCVVPFPVPMRLAPAMKYTAGFEASATVASSSATACSALTTSATLTGSAATPSAVLVDCASTAGFGAAGTAGFLWDSGSAANGVISASAEP